MNDLSNILLDLNLLTTPGVYENYSSNYDFSKYNYPMNSICIIEVLGGKLLVQKYTSINSGNIFSRRRLIDGTWTLWVQHLTENSNKVFTGVARDGQVLTEVAELLGTNRAYEVFSITGVRRLNPDNEQWICDNTSSGVQVDFETSFDEETCTIHGRAWINDLDRSKSRWIPCEVHYYIVIRG